MSVRPLRNGALRGSEESQRELSPQDRSGFAAASRGFVRGWALPGKDLINTAPNAAFDDPAGSGPALPLPPPIPVGRLVVVPCPPVQGLWGVVAAAPLDLDACARRSLLSYELASKAETDMTCLVLPTKARRLEEAQPLPAP